MTNRCTLRAFLPIRLLLIRGRDGRTAAAHVKGSEVLGITSADDALIEAGDDFGFSGEFT